VRTLDAARGLPAGVDQLDVSSRDRRGRGQTPLRRSLTVPRG